MTVGQRIKEARKNAGLTQRELAEKSGTATGTIQQYELGKRQPRLKQLLRIAETLGVNAFDLTKDDLNYPITFTVPINENFTTLLDGTVKTSIRTKMDAALDKLNPDGQQKAVERVEELTEIPRYRAETGLESTPAPTGEVDITDLADAPETFSKGK